MQDAAISKSAHQMRQLFAIMLTMCGISDPVALWHLFKDEMAEDILHQYRQRCNINNLNFNEEIYNRALVAIEDCIYNMGGNPLRSYGFQVSVVFFKCSTQG